MADAPKYTVRDLAEALGVPDHIARTKLRGAKIEKVDGVYSWSKKADFDALVKQLKGSSKNAEAKPVKKAEKAAPENKAAKKNGKEKTEGLKKKSK
jgi:hypothetical protein